MTDRHPIVAVAADDTTLSNWECATCRTLIRWVGLLDTGEWIHDLDWGPCPAGGAHIFVTDSPDDYYLATGIRRSTRRQRTSCENCGAAPPDTEETP